VEEQQKRTGRRRRAGGKGILAVVKEKGGEERFIWRMALTASNSGALGKKKRGTPVTGTKMRGDVPAATSTS